MDLKPSLYNRYVPGAVDDGWVLFNRFWGSLAVLDQAQARLVQHHRLSQLPVTTLHELHDAGFVVDAGTDEIAAAHERYLAHRHGNEQLALTVELTQDCNLACPYCYQNPYRSAGTVTAEDIGHLVAYAERLITAQARPITGIALRFIGGEPLLRRHILLDTTRQVRCLAVRLGVGANVQADTNGLLLNEEIVSALDATSVTITNRADHDRMRIRRNGRGTYDALLGRLARLAECYNAHETVLAVRFNVNADNADLVADTYRAVKTLGIRYTQFDIFPMVNHPGNRSVGVLSREDFGRLFLDVVTLKLDFGEIVRDFPRPAFSPCSAYTPYNVKITASGGLTLCDALTSARGEVAALAGPGFAPQDLFPDVAGYDPFLDPMCGRCPDIGICGGRIACRQEPCDFLPFDMDEFLRLLVRELPHHPDRFILAKD